jgi:hypothetical protein
MKTFLWFILLFELAINVHGQEFSKDFKSVTVDKQVREFPDRFDLATPLSSFISLTYVYINGRDHLLRSVNTIKNSSLFPDSTSPDSPVPDDEKKWYLDTKINEVIIYKDSVAFVISKTEDVLQFYYSARSFYFEAGKWVTAGEDAAENIEDARQFISSHIDGYFTEFRLIQKEFYGAK